MTQPEEKTFTQAEVDAVAASARKRERETITAKYADYDQLKAAAAEAGSSKTQLDKMAEQLAALTDRASKAEATNLRNEVIGTKLKGIPASLAGRLRGKTKEELEADADELVADWKAAGGALADDSAPPAAATPAAQTETRGRPRENLRSGAPITETPPVETDPMKLAALIPRN